MRSVLIFLNLFRIFRFVFISSVPFVLFCFTSFCCVHSVLFYFLLLHAPVLLCLNIFRVFRFVLLSSFPCVFFCFTSSCCVHSLLFYFLLLHALHFDLLKSFSFNLFFFLVLFLVSSLVLRPSFPPISFCLPSFFPRAFPFVLLASFRAHRFIVLVSISRVLLCSNCAVFPAPPHHNNRLERLETLLSIRRQSFRHSSAFPLRIPICRSRDISAIPLYWSFHNELVCFYGASRPWKFFYPASAGILYSGTTKWSSR